MNAFMFESERKGKGDKALDHAKKEEEGVQHSIPTERRKGTVSVLHRPGLGKKGKGRIFLSAEAPEKGKVKGFPCPPKREGGDERVV